LLIGVIVAGPDAPADVRTPPPGAWRILPEDGVISDN
jgi:hypothetical protein